MKTVYAVRVYHHDGGWMDVKLYESQARAIDHADKIKSLPAIRLAGIVKVSCVAREVEV